MQAHKKIELNKAWKFKEVFATLGAYTTTSNCVDGKYPFVEAIRSFAFCDEIVVCDNLSKDGTREKLAELEKELPQLKVYDLAMGDEPGKDGAYKAMSRAMTTTDYVIQFDSDEICLGAKEKWRKLTKSWHTHEKILALPVIEPVGSLTNVRLNDSHTPWKWRLSVGASAPEITHGISKQNQLIIDGVKYSKGSDGCELNHIVTEEMLPCKLDFNSQKMLELKSNKKFDEYQIFVQNIINNNEPCVLHVGHVNLKNKIKLYLKTWHSWWNHLYHKDDTDYCNNTYFPGIPYQDVSEEMIEEKIKQIIKETPSVQIYGLQYSP